MNLDAVFVFMPALKYLDTYLQYNLTVSMF